MCDAFGAGMGAVGGGERVVDEDVGQFRQIGGEGGIVLFLAGVEAGVLQHQDIAARQQFDGLFGGGAGAVLDEADSLAQDLTERGGHGGEGHFGDPFALGAVEMAADDDLGPLLRQFPDSGGEPLDPGQVADLAVPYRNIEIGAEQDALASDIQIVKSSERHDLLSLLQQVGRPGVRLQANGLSVSFHSLNMASKTNGQR